MDVFTKCEMCAACRVGYSTKVDNTFGPDCAQILQVDMRICGLCIYNCMWHLEHINKGS